PESPFGDDVSFQLNEGNERGQQLVIFNVDRRGVILSYSYDGNPTETIRFEPSEEQVERGREIAEDLGALGGALVRDDELGNNLRGRTCQSYSVFYGHHRDGGGGILCDDTTYSPLSEALRDFIYPYWEQIPPPPPQ
ncbi:MAG: hypothetical protein AAGA56_30665, partial [Myxococcota bacterium]